MEKKQHTLKNTVMSLPDKLIVFVGRTFSGHNHDYTMLKQELPPELDWFRDLHVRVDLGYQGIQSDYSGDHIEIPTKKPRKSKENPDMGIASSLMPPNAPIIAQQMMRHSVSITVEKKQHTLKNTVMSLPDKLIVFVGRTFSGHNHDYTMLKQELPPELDWFRDLHVRVDLGYQGIQSDYSGDHIEIPTKKPRKSKKNPDPQLNDDQKAANKALSQVRIFIEHAIGDMKRYNILVHVFRNRKADFEDDIR